MLLTDHQFSNPSFEKREYNPTCYRFGLYVSFQDA